MILSDRSIKDLILNHKLGIINPFNILDLQPNSYDMHLDDTLKTLHGKSIEEVKEDDMWSLSSEVIDILDKDNREWSIEDIRELIKENETD